MGKLLYKMPEGAAQLELGLTKVDQLVNSGRLRRGPCRAGRADCRRPTRSSLTTCKTQRTPGESEERELEMTQFNTQTINLPAATLRVAFDDLDRNMSKSGGAAILRVGWEEYEPIVSGCSEEIFYYYVGWVGDEWGLGDNGDWLDRLDLDHANRTVGSSWNRHHYLPRTTRGLNSAVLITRISEAVGCVARVYVEQDSGDSWHIFAEELAVLARQACTTAFELYHDGDDDIESVWERVVAGAEDRLRRR